MKTLASLMLAAALAAPAIALEIPLATPITYSVVIDRLELLSEDDGVAIGSDRELSTAFRFSKPIQLETNGVTIVGYIRLDAEVRQQTQAIAAAEGSGKAWDGLTRTKQAQTSRAEAMRRLRPALVATKERVERPQP